MVLFSECCSYLLSITTVDPEHVMLTLFHRLLGPKYTSAQQRTITTDTVIMGLHVHSKKA